MSWLGPWYRFAHSLQHIAEDAFEHLGRSVGKNRKTYIFCVLCFIALCAVGFMNFSVSPRSQGLRMQRVRNLYA
jgi:hypothetical protein